MLKSSSLCLYSSNLGIFWLKIEPFWPSWIQNGADGHNFERGPPKDHSDKVWLKLAQCFLTRRFLWEFPIGSYVKLSSAVVAILVEGMKCRTQFWKGTTQESFQESLVEIGSVVSEEKIFLISSPLFSNLHNRSKSAKVQSS